MEVSVSVVQPQWEEAFGEEARPELYASRTEDEDGFLPLNDPQDFVTDITNMSHQQLVASAANNQLAMKSAQDEYMVISKLIMEISGKEYVKNPQAMKQPETFEEMKESQLYGYKYDKNKPALLNRYDNTDDITEREREDVRLFQEPFEQGGFIPSMRQYKTMLDNARDRRNPDGWKPIERDGKLLVPRQQIHHDEYPKHSRAYFLRNEKEKVARPGTASSADSVETPSKPSNLQLVRTRFGGQKVPITRDASEEPSAMSTPRGRRPNTPRVNGNSALVQTRKEDSPASKRRRLNNSTSTRLSSQSASRLPQSVFKPQHPPSRSSTIYNATSLPTYLAQPLSPTSLRNRKWTTEELIDAVKHDHTWLTDDAVQAEHWKEKILNSTYPVRTFSMFKKWSFWKQENRDKRPRNRKNDSGDGKGGKPKVDDVEVVDGDETKDGIDDEVGEMMVENGEEVKEEVNGDDSSKAETGLGIEGTQLESPPAAEEKEEQLEEILDTAVSRQLENELRPSIEQTEDVKTEEDYDAEDTIVAKTDSRPITPIAAPTARRRLLRSAKRMTG